MTDIEQRIEARDTDPDYAEWTFTEEQRANGAHRRRVGGMWDEMGVLQRDFLVGQGLQPQMRFLDVGCGALRAGRFLVPYLDAGNYYGVDIGVDIIRTGYEVELDDTLRERLPTSNLRATDRFDVDFGVPFDMAIAQSVFTHVSLNHIRLCLHRVAKAMAPGGRFYATFFEKGRDFPIDGVTGVGAGEGSGARTRYTERNMYWYYRRDLKWAAERTPFEFRYIGGWDHPRGQKMVEYTRLAD
jgi:SAM-dependent methyltransferase